MPHCVPSMVRMRDRVRGACYTKHCAHAIDILSISSITASLFAGAEDSEAAEVRCDAMMRCTMLDGMMYEVVYEGYAVMYDRCVE